MPCRYSRANLAMTRWGPHAGYPWSGTPRNRVKWRWRLRDRSAGCENRRTSRARAGSLSTGAGQLQRLGHELELARPRLLGALLEAASHGLRMLPGVRLDRLPRMADFALWAAACETALWPVGTFARAYERNRRTAIEDAIDADPVAACVRAFMAERGSWTGSAADLLRDGGDPISNGGQAAARAGPAPPARSPAACVAPRPSCGHWASTSPSLAKAAPETGSSGCGRRSKIPSAPSAASAPMDRELGQ